MSRQPRTSQAAQGQTRMNEYFVPRDGIDREVISADICRYLGNDALVRPGVYENPETRQVSQGYYITAYRNLTTAMIEDLKADSARWDSERRAQTSRNSGVQYHMSETHQTRQQYGPSETPFQSDPYAAPPPRDPGYDAVRYPGTGAGGYNGASGGPVYHGQPAQSSSGNGAYGYQQPPQNPDPRYGSPSQPAGMMNSGFQSSAESPFVSTGANMPRGYSGPSDPYGGARMPSAGGSSGSHVYGSAAPSNPGYGAPAYASTHQAAPMGNSHPYAQTIPQDPFYGRAGQTSSQQGYASSGVQYKDAGHARNATPPTPQAPTSSSSSRRSDKDSDRHSSDRHHRSSRR